MVRYFYLLFWTLSLSLVAQSAPLDDDPQNDWQNIRTKQPTALHLKVTLVKDQFYMGERIDAKLNFINDDDKTPYSIEVGEWAYPAAVFHALDDKGKEVIGPLSLCRLSTGGWSMGHDLGRFSSTIPANENVSFDHPGVYRLYAVAGVSRGTASAQMGYEKVRLISDPVTITIVPLDPAEEARLIAGAVAGIHPGDPRHGMDDSTRAWMAMLKYLHTPASRAELVKLLGEPTLDNPAGDALLISSEPEVDAARIFAAVQTGKVVLGPFGVTVYAILKEAKLQAQLDKSDYQTPEGKKLSNEMQTLDKQSRQEIMSAMVQSTKKDSPEHLAALWTAFEGVMSSRGMPDEPDPDGGVARKAVAEHQLELPAANVKRMLGAWSFFGGGTKAFLPVVQQEVAARTDANAILALCSMAPEEARPLVIEEMKRSDSVFFKGSYATERLAEIPPMPLPELDDFFKAKLSDSNISLNQIVCLASVFGSEKLLPDLLALKQKPTPGYSWNANETISLYFYRMRFDSQAATADFKNDLQTGGENFRGAFGMRLRLVGWSDAALPLVRVALQSDDPDMVEVAWEMLLKHGAETDLDAIIAVLKKGAQKKESSQVGRDAAKGLLGNTRWHLTPEQKNELENLLAGD